MDCPDNFNISYWNANGIANKKMDLIYYLSRYDIDAVLIVETFLKPVHAFSIPNYIVYRVDRLSGPKGGVLIAIKCNFRHQLLKHNKLGIIETLSVKVLTRLGEFTLIAAYHPGKNTNLVTFQQDIKKLSARNDNYFICGDFNARHKSWNCVSTNAAGKLLFAEAQKGKFSIHFPDKPTYIPIDPTRNTSTLDLMLTKNLYTISKLRTITALTSDHLPVTFSIKHSSANFVSNKGIYNYKKADWNIFKNIINNSIDLTTIHPNDIINATQIDDMLHNLTSLITTAKQSAIPKAIPGKYNIIIPDYIIALIKLRNKYRKKWQRHRRNITFRNYYHALKTEIEQQMSLARNRAWSDTLKSINTQQNNTNNLFKFVKIVKNKQHTIQTLKLGNNIFLTATEKCNALKTHFENSHYLTYNTNSPMERKVTKNNRIFFARNQNHSLDPGYLVKPKLLMNIIKNLKNKKSAGCDEINNTEIKMLPKKAVLYLKIIFDSCLKLGYFPSQWKKAKIVAIPKPGKDHSNPGNYRPISLLSCIGKLFEKIIARNIRSHTDINNIIPQSQFGFQPEKSTTHQIHRLKNYIIENRNRKRSTGLVLLDTEKAFDSIWHDGLLYKLIQYNFPTYIIKIIQSFLSNRKSSVHIGHTKSNFFKPIAGVPQGSILSPILFNIFISDIPSTNNCTNYLYADDLAIAATARSPSSIIKALNGTLKAYAKFCNRWKLKTNANKSEVICVN